LSDPRVLWSGSTGFLAASSALAFVDVNFNLSIPPLVPDGTVHLYFAFTSMTGLGGGATFVNATPTAFDANGATRPFAVRDLSTGYTGSIPHTELDVDTAWPAELGGSITASFTVAFSSFMGCLQALVMSAPLTSIYTLLGEHSVGIDQNPSVTVTRPRFDYLQAGCMGSGVNTVPSLLSTDWTFTLSDHRSFSTVFSTVMTMNAAMATYTGDVGAIPTTMEWDVGVPVGNPARWAAHTTAIDTSHPVLQQLPYAQLIG